MDDITIDAVAEVLFEMRKDISNTISSLEAKVKALEEAKDNFEIVPEWEDRIYREGSYVMFNLGQKFKALCDTAKSPESEDWKRVGTQGMAFKGVFKDDESYRVGDIYIKDGSSFLQVSSDSAKIIAFRGKEGSKGKDVDPNALQKAVDALESRITKNVTEGISLDLELVAALTAQHTVQALLEGDTTNE